MTTLRVLIAALAAGFSAFVLTLDAEPLGLSARAGLALLVLFLVAWSIAVGERACMPRGGLRVPRFPLGPRLTQTKPALGAQMVVLILVLGLVVDWKTAGWAAVITAMVTIHAVRKVAVFVVPAAWVVNTLATMKEFHTLGDLVHDASDTVRAVVTFGLWAVVVTGPLVRTDVAAPISWLGRLISTIAALPMWGGAFWLFSRTPAAGWESDLKAFTFVLLGGSLLQSLILGAFNWAVDLNDRAAPTKPVPSAYAVGMALMPLLAPILAFVIVQQVPLPPELMFGAPPEAWAGLMAVLMIVPAVAASVLVAASFDRLDDPGHGILSTGLAGGALAAWFLLGPIALNWLYGFDGPAQALREAFPTHGGGAALVSQRIPGGAPLSGEYGTELALFGLPATDLARAVTLMFFGVAALSARYMRHARPGQAPASWRGFLGFLALSGAAAWFLLPRLGPVGAPLSFAASTALLLAADLFHVEIRVKSKEEAEAEAAAAEAAEIERQREAREERFRRAAEPREVIG